MNYVYKKYLKRFLDVSFALILLVALSPLLLIAALAIKVEMGSPIIFTQRRPGKDSNVFTLYKFRTMLPEEDSTGRLLSHQERLTRLGKFLRASSIDELPELINILKGDMSFIGPRPLLLEYLPYYTVEEARRHSVRPGLTGLAQVSGRNHVKWEERFALDLAYIDKLSFKTDCQILFKTLFKVFKQEGVTHFGADSSPNFDEYRKNLLG